MKRLLAGTATLMLVVSLGLVMPQAASASPCLSTDRFDGSVADMKHWLTACKGVPFDVVTVSSTTATTYDAYDATGALVSDSLTPFAGGPSCDWLGSTSNGVGGPSTSAVKACYSKGVPHLICSKFFTGNFYPYHCGPTEAYNVLAMNAFQSWADRLFTKKSGQACLKGTVKSGVTAVIIRGISGAGGPLGIFAAAVGGCMGGALTYAFIG